MFDKVNELFQSIKIEYKFLDLEKELVKIKVQPAADYKECRE